jgi:hypothetical protein
MTLMIKKIVTLFIVNIFLLAFAAEAIELSETSDHTESVSKVQTELKSTDCGDCEDDCHDKESHCFSHCFGPHHILSFKEVISLTANIKILKDSKWSYKFLYGPPTLKSKIKPPVHS